jgi:phosphoglucomutase
VVRGPPSVPKLLQIYAESFKDEHHLQTIVTEAAEVSNALQPVE